MKSSQIRVLLPLPSAYVKYGTKKSTFLQLPQTPADETFEEVCYSQPPAESIEIFKYDFQPIKFSV